MKKNGALLSAALLVPVLILAALFLQVHKSPEPDASVRSESSGDSNGFRERLLSATTKHLDLLIDPKKEKMDSLKGKSADGMTAMAYYLTYELTGNQSYRSVALEQADRIVKDMKAEKHGVLYIKEKEKDADETIAGGGPPAFGWYTAYAAYIFRKEGGRDDELRYIATVLDQYPWNEEGWWAAAIDINTGEPKEPLSKASPINKNAAIALAAGMVSEYVKDLDPALSARLKKKADQCIYDQIIPAQEADGFWHYGLNGNDPKDKDILGYFMVTTNALIQLQQFTGSYRDPVYQAALDKACTYAMNQIAPMTDPNQGPSAAHRTVGTPAHFTLAEDPKRGLSLGTILFAGRNDGEGVKIIDYWMRKFPYGDAGQDGAQSVHSSALMLYLLRQ